MFESIEASAAERRAARPGDELVSPADVTMDRAFDLPAEPALVWPWLVQLGKKRAGWYLPRGVERFLPPRRRALRRVDPAFAALRVGDVIPDYGGKSATFELAALDAPRSLVYTSRRGRTNLTWSITLEPVPVGTRVFLRLRLAPVKRTWLAKSAGELIDVLTIAGLAAGLRERLTGR